MSDATATQASNESGGLDLLRRREVCERLKCSAWRLHQMVREGEFPAPIKTGARGTRWVSSEVDQWIQDRMAQRGGAHEA